MERENHFKNLKLQFGNIDHLHIIHEIGKYYSLRTQYKEILAKGKQSESFRLKCLEQKKKVRNLVEFAIKRQEEKKK